MIKDSQHKDKTAEFEKDFHMMDRKKVFGVWDSPLHALIRNLRLEPMGGKDLLQSTT